MLTHFWTSWVWPPTVVVGLLATVGAYLALVRRVDRTCPTQPWRRGRTVSFITGTAVVGYAICGFPGVYDDTFFWAHMLQHVLITMLAAPLLVLGEPLLLVLRASSRASRRRWWLPLLRSGVVRRLTRPGFALLLFVGIMGVSHIPAVYDFALAHPLVHGYIEHPLYLTSALIYFYPVLADAPGPQRMADGAKVLSLFAMMAPMAVLGFFIYALPRLAYPFYAHVDRPFGPAPLADQQLAGAIMWCSSMVFGVLWLCLAGSHWLAGDERRTRRVDRALARDGVA